MIDPADAFPAVKKLETELSAVCEKLSAVLCKLPSDDRRSEIRALWLQIASRQAGYAQAVQMLRGQVAIPTQDNPVEAAKRREVLWHGSTRVSLWTRVTEMVSRQMLATSFPPLITERSEIVTGPEFGSLNYLMRILFDLSNPISTDREILPDTHYHDIPLSGAYFLNLMQAAQRILLAQGHEGPVRFLDVGCGGGTKVLAASAQFAVAHGIELSTDYIQHAARFFGQVGADPSVIQQADALKFKDYGSYDVIYFYRPIKDIGLASQLEAEIMKQARPGAVILAPLNASLGRRDDGAGKVVDKIYLAGRSRRDAQDIADIAEACGCETRVAETEDAVALGFWAPIVEQSRRNGFALI